MENAEKMMAKAGPNNWKMVIEADAAFHHALIDAAHNPVLKGVSQLVEGYFRFSNELLSSPSPNVRGFKRTMAEHQGLRKAIEKKKFKEAEKILATHLSRVGKKPKQNAGKNSKSKIRK